MSTLGTFDAFTSARLGIYAAQQGFMVTGNNISNINTVGYTRQRLDQVSFKAGAYDRYRSQLDNHVGSGALVMNINQIRDPYLDVRYRNTAADVGFNDTWLAGLQQIASILDEVGVGDDTNVNKAGDGRLQAQIQAVSDALRKFAKEPTSQNNDLVREAASTLCSIFNSYATKLENFRKETEKDFTDKLTEINECLTNIRDLNDEIRDNEIFGDNALELRDERNRQIDKLSELIHIKVIYSEEDIGNGRTVEKLSIYLDNDNPEPTVRTDESLLIDGVYGAQLSSPKTLPMQNDYYKPGAEAYQQPDSYLYLTDEPLKNDAGEFAYRNDAGEIDYFVDEDAAKDAGYDTAVMKGTNIPEKAQQVENDYYTVMISKLYDEHGEEWDSRTTEWEEVTVRTPTNATYEIPLTNNLAEGDEFEIAGTVYKVGDAGGPDLDTVQDPDKFAQFVADALNADGTAEYKAAAKGDGSGRIVFTAMAAGVPGSDGAPSKIASLTVTNGGNKISVGTTICTDPGYKLDKPDPLDPPEGTTTLADGSQTIISYRQKVDGTWWRVTTEVQNTRDVILDDNDLYGSLQATRELLTEAGEFTTKDVLENVDENAAIKRGIPYYQLSLDLMAKKFAEEYNKLNEGTYIGDDGFEHSKFVDQNGNEIPLASIQDYKYIVKTEVSTMQTADDGSVSIINPDTGKYELKADWKVDEKTGYCTDGDYYVGIHSDDGGDCIITDQIPVLKDDNYEEVCKALQDLDDANGTNYSDGLPTPGTQIEEGDKANIEAALKACLEDHGVDSSTKTEIETEVDIPTPGPLFSNRGDLDDTDGITASNISISQSWSNGSVELVPKFEILWDGSLDHSTQNTNADHMVTLIDTATNLLFNPKDLVPEAISDNLFTGSFNGMYNDICTTLGEDQKATTIALNMHYAQLIEIDTNRDGVSGVDLNDEAMNLMQYQKAYSAACRLMTVIDEALDRLINNTAV